MANTNKTTTPLLLPSKTRERHLYIIGKSGTGKTTLIKNLILQDITANHGVCFVDPHGDATEELLGTIPENRIEDTIYLDPTSSYTPAFNPLRLPTEPQKLTEDTLAIFKMLYGSSWGYKMEHFLRNALYTLITDREPHTLHDLRTLFVNSRYREAITSRIHNHQLKEFWTHDYDGDRQSVGAILNKLSALLAVGSPLSRLFENTDNHLPIKTIMDTQKILIVNLAKGKLGEEPSRLLGALIVAGIQQAALARTDTEEHNRVPFYLSVDEFQNYTIDSFLSILAEARKYKLYLTLANQTLGQLPSDIQRSIFGNVATIVSFQVSAEDANALKKEMHRSRIVYRNTGEVLFHPVSDLVDKKIQRLQKELEEEERKLAAFPPREQWDTEHQTKRQKVISYYKRTHGAFNLYINSNLQESMQEQLRDIDFEYGRYNWGVSQYVNILKRQITELEALDLKNLTTSMIKEQLGDKPEYKQLDYPSTDDFINLPPYHAFCRMERAENVTAFATDPPLQATAGTKGKILHLMRANYEAQEQQARREGEQQPEKLPKPPKQHFDTQGQEQAREENQPPPPTVDNPEDIPMMTEPPKLRTKKTSKQPKRPPINF